MNTEKDAYFKDLEEFVTEPMFIGNGIADIENEMRENLLSMSISLNLAKECHIADFKSLLDRLIENRRNQLQGCPGRHMIFYLWFDEQAGRLYLNLISAEHGTPPFKEFKEATMEEIIRSFLQSNYLEGIPLSEFSEIDPEEDLSEPQEFFHKVFHIVL